MHRQNPYRTNTGVHIEWFTVKRSTIYLLVFSLLGLAAAGIYGYLQVFGDRPDQPVVAANPEADKSARFLDLDGTVKVRKAGTYEWINATMGMALSSEDTIRTVGGSSARVRLFDGTEYQLKPDSILVIEEAYEDPETRATHVAVKLDSGQVSLNTPRHDVPGSRSDFSTPTTEATFEENTSAEVRFDSASRVSGFTIYKGGSALRAGDTEVNLGSAQAVDVTADSRFSKVIDLPGVPSLITPANLDVIERSTRRAVPRDRPSNVPCGHHGHNPVHARARTRLPPARGDERPTRDAPARRSGRGGARTRGACVRTPVLRPSATLRVRPGAVRDRDPGSRGETEDRCAGHAPAAPTPAAGARTAPPEASVAASGGLPPAGDTGPCGSGPSSCPRSSSVWPSRRAAPAIR